ncbi:MAG: GTPase domain-containing protein [Bacteroidales bacterium]|nr:GTPase domain-containing protein [Bacteroidales bacterium]
METNQSQTILENLLIVSQNIWKLSLKDLRHISFIKKFQNMLDGKLEPEPDSIREAELICSVLEWVMHDIFEKTRVSGVMSDDNSSLIRLYRKGIKTPLRRCIEEHKKPWLRDKLNIAFIGRPKTGKTSALNFYFGEKFPENNEEASTLTAYIYDGDNPSQTVQLVDKDGSIEEITSEQLQLFSSAHSFNFQFARMFSHMAKKSKHPDLSNMTFIDTTGLFSSNAKRAFEAFGIFDYCDAVFWFIDQRKSICQEDLTLLKDKIENKPIYVIFTFVDAKGVTESNLKKAEACYKKRIDEAGINIQGYLEFGKHEIAQNKFRIEFCNAIKSLNNNYKGALHPIDEVMASLTELQENIVNIQQNATEELNRYRIESEELRNNIKQADLTVKSAFSLAAGSSSAIEDTLLDKCQGTTSCTEGAYSILADNARLLSSSLQDIIEAWKNADYDVIEKYGTLSVKIETLGGLISKLDGIKYDIERQLDFFKR